MEADQRVRAFGERVADMGNRKENPPPIVSRVPQPSPEEVRHARQQVGLSQTGAAQLVSAAQGQPYRTWQGYEAEEGVAGHRTIPLAAWELFLLLTDQHPTYRMVRRRGVQRTGKPILALCRN